MILRIETFLSLSECFITWPSADCTCSFIETGNRTLHKRFMTVLLAHGDHGVLARRHSLLTNRPVASNVTWIHPRIIGTLQTTFIAIALIELSRAVSSRRDSTEIEQIRRSAVPHDRFALAQELVSDSELEGNFLLDRWQVEHLKTTRINI